MQNVILVRGREEGRHIVIIKDISENINTYSDIKIIHSTKGDNSFKYAWFVFTGTWDDASFGEHTRERYNLIRLKRSIEN